jgi:hypothetical protein
MGQAADCTAVANMLLMMTRKSVMLTTVVGRLTALLATMTRKKHDANDKEEPRMVSS